MALTIRYTIDSTKIRAALDRLSPEKHPQYVSDFLLSVALMVQTKAQQETIIRSSKGPVDPVRITRRTGRGPDSISVNRDALPASITVGSDVGYMALHEEGGTVSVPTSTIGAHTRTKAFGKRYKPFNVPAYTRRAHSARYPARPWLRPAIALVDPEIEALLERQMLKQVDA